MIDGRRSHDDLGYFRLGGERRHRERRWGRIVARQHRDFAVDNEFLGDALGLIRHAAVVADDHLDRAARDSGAVLLQE